MKETNQKDHILYDSIAWNIQDRQIYVGSTSVSAQGWQGWKREGWERWKVPGTGREVSRRVTKCSEIECGGGCTAPWINSEPLNGRLWMGKLYDRWITSQQSSHQKKPIYKYMIWTICKRCLNTCFLQSDTVVKGVAGVRLVCVFSIVPYFEMCVASGKFFKP